MKCSDHPLVNRKGGIDINKKNGLHLYFPDLAVDRRKMLEIRGDAIEIGSYFNGAINGNDDIFDKNVYKECVTIL